MSNLYLIDPPPSPEWFPFADSRPRSELRAGAWLIRERWEAIAEGETVGVMVPGHLETFVEDEVPVQAKADVEGPAMVGRTDFAPSGLAPDLPNEPTRLTNEDATVGWWIPEGATFTEVEQASGWPEVEVEGITLRGAYDLITALEHFLTPDVADFTQEGGDALPEHCTLIGDPHDLVVMGAVVEPNVTFDVRRGAVVLEQHSYIKGGTRLEGPVYVGPGTQILGGDISWSAIGPRCKIRGEVLNSVFLGYANKAHDGFLGHSVIGRWVNLGADTVTSNLKNTYGNVRLDVGSERIETERQLLGSLIGDHAKTAIGTLLSTGTVVGVGANVFGAAGAPRYVPPFAWGTEGEVMKKDGFLATAERVLPRRKVQVTEGVKRMLETIYEHAFATP